MTATVNRRAWKDDAIADLWECDSRAFDATDIDDDGWANPACDGDFPETVEMDVVPTARVPNPDVTPEEWEPPAGAPFLTLRQWEAIDDLAGYPGTKVFGSSVWVPKDVACEAWLSITMPADQFETVLDPGYWFDFDVPQQ